MDSSTFDDWHEYEIDWKPEAITWSVDGDVKRTLTRESTWNETGNRYEFPQTPSRMQLSLWPAGQASNAEGTIAWAGGPIDWDSEDIKDKGYYYASYSDITVECYDPPKDTDKSGDKSYVLTNKDGLEGSVKITNNDTVLASFGATGLDPDVKPSTSGSSSSSSATGNTVPENRGGSGNEPGSNGTSDGGSGSGSGSGSGDSSSGSGFSQGGDDDSSSGDSNGAYSANEGVLRSSFFAVLVAVVVLVTL